MSSKGYYTELETTERLLDWKIENESLNNNRKRTLMVEQIVQILEEGKQKEES